MNCAESQDLLIDLAYGELDRARAAEVESHVAGCAACRAEKAQIDETRKLVAPLRELEEPSKGFDEPVLRAARAEAGLQADGTPGPVVEVTGSVKPLGLSAARVDPHARVRPTEAAPARPRWARRAAVFASVAAAAGLAVVVTSSMTRKVEHAEEVPAIRVRAAAAPHARSTPDEEAAAPLAEAPAREKAFRDRLEGSGGGVSANRVTSGAGSAVGGAVAEAAKKAAPAQRQDVRPSQPKRRAAEEQKLSDRVEVPGSKPSATPVDLSEKSLKSDTYIAPAEREVASQQPQSAPALGAVVAQREGKQSPAAPAAEEARPPAKEDRAMKAGRVEPPPAYAQAPVLMAPAMPPPAAAVEHRDAADLLEDQASSARRRAAYARAAELYRSASTLRKQRGDDARAAWDLAHAVECLAAGSQVPEAISLREELRRSFPDHKGPQSAANSALRYAAPAEPATVK